MKKILLIVFSIAALIACDKENHDQGIIPGTAGNAISITEATIAPIGNEAENDQIVFTVTSDVSWKIQNRPSWLVVKPLEGKAGTTSVTMYAGINNQSEPVRSCTLRVEAADRSFSEEIEVSQERPYLKISRDTVDFTWDQCDVFKTASETITISSNTDWEIVVLRSSTQASDAAVAAEGSGTLVDWLLCSELRGSAVPEDHILYFNPAIYNIERQPKSLDLEIRGALDSYKLSFIQTNLLFTVDVIDSDDDTHCEFPACNTKEVALSIESELDWKVDSKPNWVNVAPEVGKNITDVRFDVDGANPDSNDRVGNLVFVSEAGTNPLPQRVIEIRQKGYMFNIQPASISITNNDLTSKEFSLVSSGSWAIDESSIPDWLHVSVISGLGSESGENIAVAAKNRNLDFADRSAKVGLRSTQQGNTMSRIMDVTQDKFIFNASVSELNIGTTQTTSHNLTINSSGEWAIDVSYDGSPESDWLNIEQLQGDGNAVIKYNAKTGNSLDVNRTATVSVRSVTHEMAGITNVVSSFDINQRKYTFDVNPTPDILALAYGAVDDKSISIYIDCSADWNLECPNWLVPSQMSGSNYATVTFTAQNNLEAVARSGKLIIKSEYLGSTRTFSFDVTQSAFEFDSDSVEFANIEALNAGTYTVNVVCSGNWELRGYESWIGASVTSGFGNATVTLTPQDNVELKARQSAFYVYSTLNGWRKNISISQKQFVFDTQSIAVPEFSAVEPMPANVVLGESMSTWKVQNIPSWITVSPSSGSGSATLAITPQENVNMSSRSATIRVVSDKNSSLVKEISISQAAFVFDTMAVTVPEFDVLNPEPVEVTLSASSAGWRVVGLPDWVTVSQSSGDGAGTITVTASPNFNSGSRSGRFYIESNKNSALRKEISVSQGGYVLNASTSSIDVPASGTTEYSIDVNCSGQWQAGCRENSWVHLAVWNGTGAGKITFTVDNNTETAPREATIEISSLDGYAGVVSVKVSQAAATGK